MDEARRLGRKYAASDMEEDDRRKEAAQKRYLTETQGRIVSRIKEDMEDMTITDTDDLEMMKALIKLMEDNIGEPLFVTYHRGFRNFAKKYDMG